MNKYYTMIAISLAIILIAIKILLNIKKIARTGIETDGVVVGMDMDGSADPSYNYRYPIVKFLTESNTWITKAASIGGMPALYKIGTKVTVVYQSNAPEKFFIKDKITYLLPRAIIVVGIGLILFAIINLINI